MLKLRLLPLVLLELLGSALALPSLAQDTGRVTPALLPIPLPGKAPVPPDVLRARNPAVLTMTGTWKFALTHGKIVGNTFESAAPESLVALASSYQPENPPKNAFLSFTPNIRAAPGARPSI